MMRHALISGGVSYHHALTQPGELLAGWDAIDVDRLASVDLNAYDIVLVPRSTDGEMLYARRHQFGRFLDHGGVLLAFGELWTNWFPGCQWAEECREDIQAPIIAGDHALVAGYSASDLHWHPAKERWCCHGHLVEPAGAEVPVRNARGDAWLYVDRKTTNGVILASTNLDPDTHAFHGSRVAREFFERVLSWAEAEAVLAPARRSGQAPRIAGLYSGVHFQEAFYSDPEFAPLFAFLPASELGAVNLHDYAALWIPRESNQTLLCRESAKLSRYLNEGGTIICFEEVNQPWLPVGTWSQQPRADMASLRVANHPLVAGLSPEQVNWHAHGAYEAYENAQVLVEDTNGRVTLFLDERSFGSAGRLVAGTMDPDCHAGFGTETTRPLLRAILAWVLDKEPVLGA